MNLDLINLNLSLKEGNTSKIKQFFQVLFNKENKGVQFPVDLDEVWDIVYSEKSKAVRALKTDFIHGTDFSPKMAKTKDTGRPTEKYYLSIKAFEFFIVRKDRELFSCYSEVMQAMKVIVESGHLSRFLQNLPSNWVKTFPDSFKVQALRLYNLAYDPSKNTPQFIGKFINEFIYGAMDKKLPSTLKSQRALAKTDDEALEKLHQFLNEDGKGVLKEHISTTLTIMKMSNNIDDFRTKFNHVFYQSNQLEMYLRK
jgi:hypothetical protein